MAITVKIGEAARRAATIREGVDPGPSVQIDLSTLSPEDRAILMNQAKMRDEGFEITLFSADTTVESILIAARQAHAAEAAWLAQKAADKLSAEADARAHVASALLLPPGSWIVDSGYRGYEVSMPLPQRYYGYVQEAYISARNSAPGYKDRLSAESAEAEARNEANRIERAKIEAEATEKKRLAQEAAEAEILQWIEAHGSPRLRGIVAEKIDDYEPVYRTERRQAERPGWVWLSRVCGRTEAVRGTSVTGEHLAALAEARNTVPDAVLVWLGIGEHMDECECELDDDGDKIVHQRVVLEAQFLGKHIVREIPARVVMRGPGWTAS